MKNNLHERKHKETMPVLAICYYFDKTLSPDDMALENSNSFATTHMIIKDLQQYNDWSDENKEALLK